ncbi:hypothetical protein MKW94_006266 [Papaver nudicaule]|uniref:Plastid division protein PDV2 n=1 Tax=Papaver nudicaule TaxID=74823 RepID=A0AA42AV45_PAPNU|nr:hypothetical protein [Papaver nudicaule]
MERGDEIGIVLGRASELKLKIRKCVDSAITRRTNTGDHNQEVIEDTVGGDGFAETESLLNITDALESLEEQLTSFQRLQQQQRYEKEAALAQIDHSREILLNKLNEYKGDDLEVIREITSFASETVEHNADLILPPYSSRPRNVPSTRMNALNGVTSLNTIHQAKKLNKSEKKQSQSSAKNSPTGLRLMFSMAVKTVLTLVSVASVLTFAGFEPSLRRRNTVCKVLYPSQNLAAEEEKTKPTTGHCPPGKVLVMENGKPRYIVKERVEIPFEPVVTMPNVNYGCG